MEIREAIEWHGAHTLLENGRDQEVFDKTIVKVLSILNEHLGECVAEYKFEAVGLLRLVLRGKTKRLIGGLTGDHIAIYKRKGDGQ